MGLRLCTFYLEALSLGLIVKITNVVYKVDRLTRSLARLCQAELFDAHGVSFVSVTQQFNTTTSMGRLILVVCAVRAGGHRRGDPGQDWSFQTQGPLGRRRGALGLPDQRSQDRRCRTRSEDRPAHLPALSRTLKLEPVAGR